MEFPLDIESKTGKEVAQTLNQREIIVQLIHNILSRSGCSTSEIQITEEECNALKLLGINCNTFEGFLSYLVQEDDESAA
jgi:hypothetical protein